METLRCLRRHKTLMMMNGRCLAVPLSTSPRRYDVILHDDQPRSLPPVLCTYYNTSSRWSRDGFPNATFGSILHSSPTHLISFQSSPYHHTSPQNTSHSAHKVKDSKRTRSKAIGKKPRRCHSDPKESQGFARIKIIETSQAHKGIHR
jgi:hypothetical protein